VNDPACGAGALLIAFAGVCRAAGINYQTSIEFVAQDIDFTAAMMCYIQLSLLGCPGYVIVGNSLARPPKEELSEEYDIWYTPLYFSELWCRRRVFHMSHEKPTQEAHKLVLTDTDGGQLQFMIS
jgi:type I restriction-modification system DNA methylase subunit